MITDPIADYLTRVRNAIMAGHRVVEVPASKIKKEIIALHSYKVPGISIEKINCNTAATQWIKKVTK